MSDDDDNKKIVPFTVIGGNDEAIDDAEAEHLISYLAGLPPMQYELQRERIGSKLRIRLTALDKIVEAKRRQLEREEHGIELERMPSAAAVAGAKLIGDLITDLTRYVSLDEDYAAVAAFWTLHTYNVNQCPITPRLAVTAPQPRCGKTTLMNWLASVVQRPLSSVNVSPASVYRVVEKRQPTLLIDEADTFLGTNHELRGVLNSGHQKNGHVLRWDAAIGDVRSFSTFCGCAISLIGALPPTLQDRSIRIRLRRRKPDEPIASLRTDQLNDGLARRCARWAIDNQYLYDACNPTIPEQLFNRVEDNWRPLLTLADVIGAEWPTLLRQIAVRVAEIDAGEDPSADTQLLRDIREIFAGRAWVKTEDLITGLELREQGISSKRLANRLKPYGIKPKQERRGVQVERGYFARDFADTFARYLNVADVPLVPDAERPVAKGQEATGTSGTNGTRDSNETRPKALRRF